MKSAIIRKEFYDPDINKLLRVSFRCYLTFKKTQSLKLKFINNDFAQLHKNTGRAFFYYGDELYLDTKLKEDTLTLFHNDSFKFKKCLIFLYKSKIKKKNKYLEYTYSCEL